MICFTSSFGCNLKNPAKFYKIHQKNLYNFNATDEFQALKFFKESFELFQNVFG